MEGKLPPPIHGATFPSSSGLSQIQFLYLPRWQDLLQHLFSLHCHALVPRAIILQGLDQYCSRKLDGQVENKHEVDEGESSHVALLCAALLDALSVCSIRNANQETFCICTYEEGFRESDNHPSLFNPLSVFFDNIWFMRPAPSTCSEGKSALVCSRSCNCQLVSIEKVLHPCKELQNGSNLEFLCKSSAIFLQKVQEMVKSLCLLP
ncbi:hypothetical protein J437_LFUL001866 [Ladona fulva]|uniref:Uncharacterized protein n=1 Tax=Ladona fulva TaxID=123851 RepID=A0A8K0JU33_LADFU|nr:hypothetical protein J437_LFUL001866 [Ladona fulva]